MNFSDKQLDQLDEYCTNSDELYITACNGVGQEFTVIGLISLVKGKELNGIDAVAEEIYNGVLDNAIFVEFGPEDEEPDDAYRTSYVAPFFTTLPNSEGSQISNFLIKEIRLAKNNKVIFDNANEYYNHLNRANMRGIGYKLAQHKHNINCGSKNDIAKKLDMLVGQPININDHKGILYYVNRIVNRGSSENIELFYIDCNKFQTIEFPTDSFIDIKKGVIRIRAPYLLHEEYQEDENGNVKDIITGERFEQ